jgi:uncharacterized protein YegL
MMKLYIIITLFIASFVLFGPIVLIPVGLYLVAGMAIFLIGTWPAIGKKKSIRRRCGQKWVYKDESIDVTLEATASQLPPIVESGDPWNIVLVIDKSSSMMGTALGNAKIAAKNLVSSTPRDFRYGIVEFQESAHIRSQLTSNKVKLKFTISRIFSAGGTAIHEGLHLAARVLRHELKPGKKNAVILLSDGGSSHEPALREAADLKEQGVEIYAIGLGACDEELMQRIASDSDKYFYARSSKELKQLYFTIGRIIQNARAKEVEISESPNVKKAPLRVFAWGDIQPSSFDFDSDNSTKSIAVEWYLPSLQNEKVELDYRLMSRCYGWYRVSEKKAQMKLKDQTGKDYTFKSNKGPYVLIVPRFFLSEILWVFLNPLFWIVFKNWGCKTEEVTELGTYQNPERVPIPQPELLPTLKSQFKLAVTPTLAIGVGYGGIHAVTHLKRLLWEHDEDVEIKKKVTFAAFDTVNPWFSDTVKIGHISLEPGEKYNVHAPVSPFIRTESEREEPSQDYIWLNARQKRAEGIDYDTGFGTNLDRRIGRLMVLHHRDDIDLKSLIRQLRQNNQAETLQVCIAGTLSGGSSSGIILELCYSTRRILDELDIPGVDITLFLMDYQVETDDTCRDDKKPVVHANRDGFINELARFFTARGHQCSPLHGDPPVERWFDRIVWIDKKQNTSNLADLYPQCAMLMYSWAVENSFRTLLSNNTQHIHDGLLVHRFQTDTAFFFKRTLENYFSVRLLLTTIGNQLLGLPQHPRDYSQDSLDPGEIKKYIDDAFELLYTHPGWKAALPILMKNKNIILDPQPRNVSTFLSHAGLMAVIESASLEKVNMFLDNEQNAFDTLLFSWLECLLSTHKDKNIVTPREKKLPTAYLSLSLLKQNLAQIKNIVESVPEDADYLLRQRCHTVAEMCSRFTVITDRWLEKLSQWWTLLGDGNEHLTGTCRALNLLINELEKSIQATRAYMTPHFTFDARVEDEIYRHYFAQLEHRILEQLHWHVKEDSLDIHFLIVDEEDVNTYLPDLKNPSVSEAIFQVLLTLPAYFASEKNKWHEATIREIIKLTRQGGHDIIEDYFIPRMSTNTLPNLLYLESLIAETLQKQVSAGMVSQNLESQNPLVSGFYHYKLNHEIVSSREQFDPRKLPTYVFSEEWNAYNALKVYSNLTDEEPLTPPYPVIALCPNMKKFLGVVQQGFLAGQIKQTRAEARLVFRFHSLEAPQMENDDDAIINLLRIVIESRDAAIESILDAGYDEILKLDLKTLKNKMGKVNLPLFGQLSEQLFQLTAGAVEYYKNLT